MGSGGRAPEDGFRRTGSRGRVPEDRFRRTGSGGRAPEDGLRRTGSGGRAPEDGLRRTGSRGWAPEDGLRRMGSRGRVPEDGFRRTGSRERVSENGVLKIRFPETGYQRQGSRDRGLEHPVPKTGVPKTGVPETGVPKTGVPETGFQRPRIGGSGRQSVTRLTAFMADTEIFQVSIQKTYTLTEWKDDLKKLLRGAGQNGTPTVFLFADHQIKDEAFLEDISMILTTGDIPNLFDNEEKRAIIEKMNHLAPVGKAKLDITPSNTYGKFTERVQQNLHLILVISPIGEAFRNRLRQFPALINCCTIDWFQAWPEDALEKVANHFLDDVEMSQEIRNEAVLMCEHFHQSVVTLSERFYETLQRRTYITPTSYLELIKIFKTLLERKRLELLTNKNRYTVGLEKLDFAASQIAIMQQELTELKPLLMEQDRETEELLKIIADETLEVEIVKQVVETDEATANKAAQEARTIKVECEQKLSVAMPALNDAITALDTLKASDITLVKTMQNPPSGVRLTLTAICILKGIKPEKKVDTNGKSTDDYWLSAKKMLSDRKFLESLK
ncbi:hypothetical protein scyTo_0017282, partial [Scyliorhinus torazame]|nr:hypothetical protein [Scyliorhinus torazame]